MNILTNAFQALREQEAARRLAVRTRQAASRFLPGQNELAEVIRIAIFNNGPSIPTQDLPRIFNPFFTTKEPGEGTGLGLAVTHGIVQEHGGNIWARNISGAGVAFFVELPIQDLFSEEELT